jgi:hypothetical protein
MRVKLAKQGGVTVATSAVPLAVKLPNGREATYEDMQIYGQIMQDFIRDQEALLPQVKDTRRHNQIIDYLQTLADGYNEQLGIYSAAEAQRQQELLVVMLRFIGG